MQEQDQIPVYSHNPCHGTKFPLLVLDVKRTVCRPYNEGFRMLHWHEELQFVYVKRGVVHIRIWEEEYDVPEGCGMFINCNALHYITEKEDCRYRSFLIPPKMLAFFSGSIMEEREVEKITKNSLLSHVLLEARNPVCEGVLKRLKLLEEMYFERAKELHWEYRLSLCMTELWLEFVELVLEGPLAKAFGPSGKSRKMTDGRHERIQRLVAFVHRNYSRRLSLEEIAASASISQTECLRCFQKYIGYSPYQYLMHYRLQVSTQLLKSGDMSVTRIALQVGFQSVSSYISYFKKHYGMTPAKYRRREL